MDLITDITTDSGSTIYVTRVMTIHLLDVGQHHLTLCQRIVSTQLSHILATGIQWHTNMFANQPVPLSRGSASTLNPTERFLCCVCTGATCLSDELGGPLFDEALRQESKDSLDDWDILVVIQDRIEGPCEDFDCYCKAVFSVAYRLKNSLTED